MDYGSLLSQLSGAIAGSMNSFGAGASRVSRPQIPNGFSDALSNGLYRLNTSGALPMLNWSMGNATRAGGPFEAMQQGYFKAGQSASWAVKPGQENKEQGKPNPQGPQLPDIGPVTQDQGKPIRPTSSTNISPPTVDDSGGGGEPAPYSVITTDKSIHGLSLSAASIDRILAGTPMEGRGQFIYDQAMRTGIDPIVVLAIWKREHNFMRARGVATEGNNPGSIVNTNGAYGEVGTVPGVGGHVFGKYATLEDGIKANFDLLAREYGGMTIGRMGEKYAPVAAGNSPTWANDVARFADEFYRWVNEVME